VIYDLFMKASSAVAMLIE